jgi:flagellar M-ring protein FliF
MSQPAQWLAQIPALSKLSSWPKLLQIGLAAAAITVIVMLLLWTRTPDYRVLFSNLEDRDGGAIITALTQMNVPYQFSDSGKAILVPADKVYGTRLQLAEQGLPRGGNVGFELLDHTRFGASQFSEQITYQRALEGELVSSIEAVNAIRQARVHLAIPRESLFVRERQAPTASVLLTLYPGRALSPPQVSAITWLVSSSVPNLTAEHVTVVDQNGRLLTEPSGEAGVDGAQRAFVNDIEQRTVQRILTLVTPLVGASNVRAQASADVDFVQREHTSEVYRPNQKPGEAAVRSEQTSALSQNNVPAPQGVPGARTTQPPPSVTAPLVTPPQRGVTPAQANRAPVQAAPAGTEALTTGGAAPTAPTSNRHDATTNYEVDKTITHVKEPLGQLRRLSVAVVINDQHDKDGNIKPMDQAGMAKLNGLVQQAMGYSATRGDTLTIISSPFNDTSVEVLPIWKDPVYQTMAMQLGKYLLIALITLLLWRNLLKPILKNIVNPENMVAHPRSEAAGAAAGAAAERANAEAAKKRASEISRYEDNLSVARTMAEKDPRAVAMVLRSWMDKDGKQ